MMRNRSLWIALALVMLGLALRLVGIDWGLPQVYEEAYPFKKAWPMWGFGPDQGLDLNPHFFNYPTLYFYVQWLGQGLLYLLLRAFGEVHSVMDYRVLYELDKTPFYIMGRTITVLFAAETVLVTFLLGRRVHSSAVGALAGFLVAVNAYHVTKSQVVEVDVPLTFFVVLTLYFAMRVLEEPTWRHSLLVGICGGLATSTKYSGLFLVLPILAAHWLALRRSEREQQSARHPAAPEHRASTGTQHARTSPPAALKSAKTARPTVDGDAAALRRRLLVQPLAALAVFALAVVLTSPYIVLDFENFRIGFNYERDHMQTGHFGLDHSPAIFYYLRVLATSLLGWPLALVSLIALVVLAGIRRQGWAIVLAVFPVAYVAAISSFSMKAERYVLPLVPIAAVLAGTFVSEICAFMRRLRPRLVFATGAGLALLLAAPSFVGYARGLSRLRDDTRTLARRWLEANVPTGAWVVTESYGPEPTSAIDIASVSLDLRQRIYDQLGSAKVYAMFAIPMLQVRAELMSVFYDMRTYRTLADYVVTSSSISSRYRKDPRLYAPMLAFYDSLDAHFQLVQEFDEDDGIGPHLRIYKNPRFDRVFADRDSVPTPSSIPRLVETVSGSVGPFYQRMGVNYEAFGFDAQAADAYLLATQYTDPNPTFRFNCVTGALRCYLRAGWGAEFLALLDQVERGAQSAEERAYWQQLRRQVLSEAATP